MSYKVIVFDWDGTLVDSEQHIVDSLRYAANKMALPERTHDEFKRIIGLGMREAILSLYPDIGEGDIQRVRQHYSEGFFSQSTDVTQLFEGVEDVLSELRSRDRKLAVATGKSRNGLEKALDSTALRSYFHLTKCADETRSKPDPLMLEQIAEHFDVLPGEMLMVGDTEFDLEMAAKLGVPSLAVSYGVHDRKNLLKHKPIEVIDHLSEVLAYM